MSPPAAAALVVHPHLHPRRTGVTRHVETVVPLLAREGELEVTSWGKSLDPSLPRESFASLWRRLSRAPRAVWHAHRNNELLIGLLLRLAQQSLRVVFTRHSATRPGLWTRLLARRADRVLTLDPDSARFFEGDVRVVPHGVDTARFRPPSSPEERAHAKKALGLDPERPVLGVIGRIRPEKGQGDLADALSQLEPATSSPWQVVMVGRVAPEHRAFAAALQSKLGARLRLLPERPEIEGVFRALDVLVQPSRSEGYSLVVLEAMSSGCCVVSTRDVPAARDAIEDGRTGFLYATADVPALTETLTRVLSAPSLISSVGAAAAKAISERHGLEQEARALSSIYRELIGRELIDRELLR